MTEEEGRDLTPREKLKFRLRSKRWKDSKWDKFDEFHGDLKKLERMRAQMSPEDQKEFDRRWQEEMNK